MGRSNDPPPQIFHPVISLQALPLFIQSDEEGGKGVDVPYQPSVRAQQGLCGMILRVQALWEEGPGENALEDETGGEAVVSLLRDWMLPDLSTQAVCLKGD